MDTHFPPTREEFYHVQMDVKHVQSVQISHADRLLRLEKRQADDAALKLVWNSPFPSVLGGTPQQGQFQHCSVNLVTNSDSKFYTGPVHTSSAEPFYDFDDEHGQNLLGSLQLDAEEEPVRRGTSRANSVRFDVSTIHGSSWAQGPRTSSDYGPARPSSGFGSHPVTERSLPHKSDGRHSSAGHSVHSIHSVPSGRTSSLGLDTNFTIGGPDDDVLLDIPRAPPGLFILGTVPSIIRCWLNEDYSHSSLRYAVICTGSQKSLLNFSIIKDLGLHDQIQKNSTGNCYIRLPVYLPEAIITQPASRTNSPAPQLPTLTVNFEVVNINQQSNSERRKAIGVFIGSDTLRAYNADILFSQNVMNLYGDDRNKLSVPLVRPEDENIFKNLRTTYVGPEKVELNATARPFTPVEQKPKDKAANLFGVVFAERVKMPGDFAGAADKESFSHKEAAQLSSQVEAQNQDSASMAEATISNDGPATCRNNVDHFHGINHGDENQGGAADNHVIESSITGPERRESSGVIWSSWRTAGLPNNGVDTSRENLPVSSQHRTARGRRSMKVLKPSKSSQNGRSSSAARTGASYEPPTQRASGESRRKSQVAMSENSAPLRWEPKRTVSDEKPAKDLLPLVNASKSSNPIGGASAFAWMNLGKPITTSTRTD